MATVRVRWYCGFDIDTSDIPDGPGRYGVGRYSISVPECGTQFITEVDISDWEDGCASAICPNCGAALSQGFDDPEAEEIDYDVR